VVTVPAREIEEMNSESALNPMIKDVPWELMLRNNRYGGSAISAEARTYDLDQLSSRLDNSVTLAANDNASKAAPTIDDTEWIGDVFDKLAAQVPPEEWNKLPPDMAATVDAKLYRR
jgi:hypothetical protein